MTTIESFFQMARGLGARRCWRYGEREYSWTEAAQIVRRMARALLALGVKPGESVNIVGPNRPEWLIADLGALAAGAIPTPIYPTLTAEQAHYIANHSGAKVAVVGDVSLREKLAGTQLREFVLFDELDQFLRRGDTVPEAELDKRLAGLQAKSAATLIYTSGTTGPPKAVMLSHENLAFAASIAQKIGNVGPDDLVLCYLPLSHIAEQMISVHGPAVTGSSIWFCDNLDKLGETLTRARPTIFFGVPRVWEKMQGRVEERLKASPPHRRAIVGWARKDQLNGGGPVSRFLLSKIRQALGLDRARFCVSGAAKLGLATARFFESLGLPVLDMWGMTESTAMGTANLPEARKLGTVGCAEPGVEIQIAPDGEILTRGPHVFMGYYKDPQATAEAIDAAGFLHTGDVGELDAQGYLRITDRKKDLLITSGGKNVSPQNIEAALSRIEGVAQAVVVGDARKFLGALIVPEQPGKAQDADFLRHVGKEIEKVNAQLAQYETIKKFKVLPAQFSIESGELTPTLKLKRKVVAQKYAKEIDDLFAERN
jgi:long-subunit acyl-CoA synthetase (AMP-forming)